MHVWMELNVSYLKKSLISLVLTAAGHLFSFRKFCTNISEFYWKFPFSGVRISGTLSCVCVLSANMYRTICLGTKANQMVLYHNIQSIPLLTFRIPYSRFVFVFSSSVVWLLLFFNLADLFPIKTIIHLIYGAVNWLQDLKPNTFFQNEKKKKKKWKNPDELSTKTETTATVKTTTTTFSH